MYDELKTFVLNTTTPEMGSLLVETATTLTQLGVDTIEWGVDSLLANPSGLDSATLLQQLHSLLFDAICAVLGQFSVDLTENATLRDALEILLGLGLLPNYEDVVSLENLCLGPFDPTTKILDLLELVTPYTVEDLLPVIANVDQALIDQILATIPIDNPQPPINDVATTIKVRLRSYFSHYHGSAVENLVVFENLSVGGLWSSLVDERLSDMLEQAVEQRVIDYVGWLMSSTTPDDQLHASGLLYLDRLANDPLEHKEISRVYHAIMESVNA